MIVKQKNSIDILIEEKDIDHFHSIMNYSKEVFEYSVELYQDINATVTLRITNNGVEDEFSYVSIIVLLNKEDKYVPFYSFIQKDNKNNIIEFFKNLEYNNDLFRLHIDTNCEKEEEVCYFI